MRFNDAIIGAVLVVFAIAEITYTRTFPSLHGQNYGPNLFPTVIGVGLFGCGCILIVRGLLARRVQAPQSADSFGAHWVDLRNIAKSNPARINAALVILIPLFYVLLSDQIGFITISTAAIFILLYRLGSSFFIASLLAIVTTAVLQILFAKVLLVPLPPGWLQGLVY
ncbi:MAG: putative tricarboxylic transport membrane protein [Granulosicoccus sp.]|jgi:putative tricarboxylic transport membrane protein